MKWFAVKDTAKIEIGEVSTQISKKEKTLSVTTTVTMKNQPDWVDESVSEIKIFNQSNIRPTICSGILNLTSRRPMLQVSIWIKQTTIKSSSMKLSKRLFRQQSLSTAYKMDAT
jgi:hypothetical protein